MNLRKKILAVMLLFSMAISIVMPAFAADNGRTNNETTKLVNLRRKPTCLRVG